MAADGLAIQEACASAGKVLIYFSLNVLVSTLAGLIVLNWKNGCRLFQILISMG